MREERGGEREVQLLRSVRVCVWCGRWLRGGWEKERGQRREEFQKKKKNKKEESHGVPDRMQKRARGERGRGWEAGEGTANAMYSNR